MYHWDLPQTLQDMGGWTNPLIIDYMVNFADLLFHLYGDKVRHNFAAYSLVLWLILNISFSTGKMVDNVERAEGNHSRLRKRRLCSSSEARLASKLHSSSQYSHCSWKNLQVIR